MCPASDVRLPASALDPRPTRSIWSRQKINARRRQTLGGGRRRERGAIQLSNNPLIRFPEVRFPDYSSLFEGRMPQFPRSAFRLSRFKKLPNEPISVLPDHADYQQFAKNRAPVGRKNEPIFGAVPAAERGSAARSSVQQAGRSRIFATLQKASCCGSQSRAPAHFKI